MASLTRSALFLLLLLPACGDADDHENDADMAGVGAACEDDMACEAYEEADETGGAELVCLTQFAGGYCGLSGCTENVDCPDGSTCVVHTDGVNYCFRSCVDKAECNAHRPAEAESNCSANITYVDADTSGKACVPPSSGL